MIIFYKFSNRFIYDDHMHWIQRKLGKEKNCFLKDFCFIAFLYEKEFILLQK